MFNDGGSISHDSTHKDDHYPKMSKQSEWTGVFYFNVSGDLKCLSDKKPYGWCYRRQADIAMWIKLNGNIRPENPLDPYKVDFPELRILLPISTGNQITTHQHGIQSLELTQDLYKLIIEDPYAKAALIASLTGGKDVAFHSVHGSSKKKSKPSLKKKKKKKQNKNIQAPQNVSLNMLANQHGFYLIPFPLEKLAIVKFANMLATLLGWTEKFVSYTAMCHSKNVPQHADDHTIGRKFIIVKMSQKSVPVTFYTNHAKDYNGRTTKFVFAPEPWSIYVVDDHPRFFAHEILSQNHRCVLRLGYGEFTREEWKSKTVCSKDCACYGGRD
jgi:hypothetical protein